jgi:hypothetical protein
LSVAGRRAAGERIDQRGSRKGRQAALELLLRLTRINDEGRHTRQRIARDRSGRGSPATARTAAGERVLRLLAGERRADVAAANARRHACGWSRPAASRTSGATST